MTLVELQDILGRRIETTLREDLTPEDRQIANEQSKLVVDIAKQMAGTLWGIWKTRDSIVFLKGFDSRTDVGTVSPEMRLTHNQYQILVGRAAKTVYATLLDGAKEEIERAVKFSMIAIDAEKHLLDVEQAKEKYGFDELEQKYVKGVKDE